jgi:hypothetical protein
VSWCGCPHARVTVIISMSNAAADTGTSGPTEHVGDHRDVSRVSRA